MILAHKTLRDEVGIKVVTIAFACIVVIPALFACAGAPLVEVIARLAVGNRLAATVVLVLIAELVGPDTRENRFAPEEQNAHEDELKDRLHGDVAPHGHRDETRSTLVRKAVEKFW